MIKIEFEYINNNISIYPHFLHASPLDDEAHFFFSLKNDFFLKWFLDSPFILVFFKEKKNKK